MSEKLLLALFLLLSLTACGQSENRANSEMPQPLETIDLGALVTEDLPERVWGKALLADRGWSEPNSFKVTAWERELPGGVVSGSNSYYTFFNHGGPHVDAPNHIGLDGGLDSYKVDVFSGPLKVFDVSQFAAGRSVGVDFFQNQNIDPGDVVVIYTGYQAPKGDKAYPSTITMSRQAAEYLAAIPIRAIGTDAWSLYTFDDTRPIEAEKVLGRVAPVHEAFLSEGIPIYEELFNLDQLLGKTNMFFTGVPLNVKDGDGMIVRPVVFIY